MAITEVSAAGAMKMAPQALRKIDFGDGNGALRGWRT
jgi:hypothetical protein